MILKPPIISGTSEFHVINVYNVNKWRLLLYNYLKLLFCLCSPQAARRYCPHHVGHYVGMDVHDTPELSRSQPLQPGMAITIEPGIKLGF